MDIRKMYEDFLEKEDFTEDEYPFREYQRDIMDDIRIMHHYEEDVNAEV